MATRYRDLQSPIAIDTTPLETGDSEAAAALARAFKTFEGIAAEHAGNLSANLGARRGAEAGVSGTPEFRAGIRATTAYGATYNNAAMRSYAIKAEADAEDTAARLEVESQNDPDKFAVLFTASRDESLKQAPREARGTLATIYARRLGDGVARLRAAQAKEQNELARGDLSEGLERGVDRAAQLYAAGDPVSYEYAVEEETKNQLMIDGAVNTGTISAAEGIALHKKAQRQLTAQTVSARFRKTLESSYGNPVNFIEKLRKENRVSEALSPKEEEQLLDQLMGDLREHNALQAAGLAESNATLKARYEQGNRDATSELFTGTLTVGKLNEMVRQQRLDPDRATSLANELQSGGVAADDTKEAFHVRTNLLNFTEEEIEQNHKLSWKTRSELVLKRREEADGWKGTQAAREGEARIERALGIAPGVMRQALTIQEREQLDQAKTEWYSEIDKLPAAERQAAVITAAEDVVGRYIRKNKASKAQSQRKYKENYIRNAKPREEMGEEERKEFDRAVAGYDAKIATYEAEAARK